MKYAFLLLLASSFIVSSCSKTDNSHSLPNVITLNDVGSSFTMKSTYPVSAADVVEVSLIKTTSSSALIIHAYNPTTTRQFDINFKAYGSYTGLGHFAQSNTYNNENTLVEYFTNGESFNIDSTSAQVTTSSATLLEGTFDLWLSNSKGKRTAHGSFSARNPVIQ